MSQEKKISIVDKVLLVIIVVVWLDQEFFKFTEPSHKKFLSFFEPTTSVVHAFLRLGEKPLK